MTSRVAGSLSIPLALSVPESEPRESGDSETSSPSDRRTWPKSRSFIEAWSCVFGSGLPGRTMRLPLVSPPNPAKRQVAWKSRRGSPSAWTPPFTTPRFFDTAPSTAIAPRASRLKSRARRSYVRPRGPEPLMKLRPPNGVSSSAELLSTSQRVGFARASNSAGRVRVTSPSATRARKPKPFDP